METLTANAVPARELDEIDSVVQSLPDGSDLARSLMGLVESLRTGHDVVIGRGAGTMTPSQAAAVLGMSRTHLYKLLDAGEIPQLKVGRDRRLSIVDVMAFDERRQLAKRELAERFAHHDRSRSALFDILSSES